jgi:hypothetical protein
VLFVLGSWMSVKRGVNAKGSGGLVGRRSCWVSCSVVLVVLVVVGISRFGKEWVNPGCVT